MLGCGVGLCAADPRPLAERRADALGALAAGGDRLACDCADPDCAAGQNDSAPRTAVVHVIADAATLAAATVPKAIVAGPASVPEATLAAASVPEATVAEPANLAGANLAEPANLAGATVAETRASTIPVGPRTGPPRPAFVIGGGVLPAPLLAPLLDRATLRQVRHPGDAPPEPHYVPSRALAEFVRCRDLTCRFPGCDVPADRCDLDQTVPSRLGPRTPRS